MQRYSDDFETTTDINDCRVWAWAMCEIDTMRMRYGHNIDSFMEMLSILGGEHYFHNETFDGEFIVHWLLMHDYQHTEEQPEKKEFNTIIGDNGKYYMIAIRFENNRYCRIYDSLKKLPLSVRALAKAFNLDMSKGEIDYHKYRPVGYRMDAVEKDYITRDVKIVAKCLKMMFNENMQKMTIGADSLEAYKLSIGYKTFKKWFPELTPEMDQKIRHAYDGGFVQVNPKFQNIHIKERGCVLDVNSLYSYVMRHKLMPYGMPLEFSGKYPEIESYPLYIQYLRCTFKLKEGYIPTIKVKGSRYFAENEYIRESPVEMVLSLTNIDLEIFMEHYEVDVTEWLGGVMFHAQYGMFDQYIDANMEIKRKSKGGKRQLAKLRMNNLYGKFGVNPTRRHKIPELKAYIDENGETRYKVGYRLSDPEQTKSVYIPIACFCTAWARSVTIKASQQCYDHWMYSDTDSMHLIGDAQQYSDLLWIDDNELGAWKIESRFNEAKYIRQKTYIELYYSNKEEYEANQALLADNDPDASPYFRYDPARDLYYEMVIKCAGMPEAIKETMDFEHFEVGFQTETGKLKPKHVHGGIVLVDTPFSIRKHVTKTFTSSL